MWSKRARDRGFVVYAACLLIILMVALYIRVDFVRTVVHDTSPDADNYAATAIQLVEKGVYGYKLPGLDSPNAYTTPGYPLFVSMNYVVSDWLHVNTLTLIRYVQIMLSLGTLLMIAHLTLRLSRSRMAALAAALLAAIYPAFVWANGAILTEVLATFFLVAYIVVQLRAMETGGGWYAAAAGALLGLTVLARPEFLPIFVALYLFSWLQRRDVRQLKLLLITGLAVSAVMLPWWIRNAVTLHQVVLTATQANPLYAGTFPDNDFSDAMVAPAGKTEKQIAIERIKVGFTEHTARFVHWYTIGKLKAIYGEMFYASFKTPYPVIAFGGLLHKAIVAFGAAAMVLMAIRWRRPENVLSLFIVVMSCIRLLFIPVYRYNFTVMPIFIVLICVVLGQLIVFARERLVPNRRGMMYLSR